jgi:hypothetical protein
VVPTSSCAQLNTLFTPEKRAYKHINRVSIPDGKRVGGLRIFRARSLAVFVLDAVDDQLELVLGEVASWDVWRIDVHSGRIADGVTSN